MVYIFVSHVCETICDRRCIFENKGDLNERLYIKTPIEGSFNAIRDCLNCLYKIYLLCWYITNLCNYYSIYNCFIWTCAVGLTSLCQWHAVLLFIICFSHHWEAFPSLYKNGSISFCLSLAPGSALTYLHPQISTSKKKRTKTLSGRSRPVAVACTFTGQILKICASDEDVTSLL